MPYPYGPQQQQQLDPALVQQLMQLQAQQAAQSKVAQQRALADAMRQDAGRQLQGRSVGDKDRIYRAPGALNLAANIGQQFAGAYQQGQAQQGADRMGQQNVDAARAYFEALQRGPQR